MTDQPQNGPTERTGAGSEPTGDMPAALGPDSPTDVQPVDESEPAAVPETREAPAAPPPPPPPATTTAVDSQGPPLAVVPPEPGESVSAPPPPVPPTPAWRPEDEPSGPAAAAADRPEVAIGAAFAGGLVLALILKRLAR